MARELRVAWADRDMAIGALTRCGVALDVHSSSSLVSHAKSAGRQVHDLLCERDAARAACATWAETCGHANMVILGMSEAARGIMNEPHDAREQPIRDLCVRANQALVSGARLGAACAEMRAALEVLVAMVASDATDGLLAAMANAAALLARPNLGAGMVVVPRGVVASVRQSLEIAERLRRFAVRVVCSPRNAADDVIVSHDLARSIDDLNRDDANFAAAIADLDALLKGGG